MSFFKYKGQIFQWDLNIELDVCSIPSDGYVHFKSAGSDVLSVQPVDGKVSIPNIILQEAGSFDVYAYTDNAEEKRTLVRETFYINPRPCPPSYIYDPTPVITYPELIQLVDDMQSLIAEWQGKVIAIPEGGETGQVLKKKSDGDYDTEWGTGGGGGTSDHRQLTNRDASDQHPMIAITGLQTALDWKQAVISDLETIRSGASAGATAVQPSGLSSYATKAEIDEKGYQDAEDVEDAINAKLNEFVITITFNPQTMEFTSDKTYAQIQSAYGEGKNLRGVMDQAGLELKLAFCGMLVDDPLEPTYNSFAFCPGDTFTLDDSTAGLVGQKMMILVKDDNSVMVTINNFIDQITVQSMIDTAVGSSTTTLDGINDGLEGLL